MLLKEAQKLGRKEIYGRRFSCRVGKPYVSVLGKGHKAVSFRLDARLLLLSVCGFSHGGSHKARGRNATRHKAVQRVSQRKKQKGGRSVMRFKRWLCVIMALITILMTFAGCSSANNGDSTLGSVEKLSDLSGRKIGIVTGTMTSVLVPKLIPDAIYVEFNSVADVKMALESGKVDAFPTDESVYLAMRWEGSEVSRVDEAIAPSDYGVIFTKGKNLKLQNEFNAYLERIYGKKGRHGRLFLFSVC